MVTIEDFQRLELRVGTVREARSHPAARHPAYQLIIDFGPLGMKRSSAQVTTRYDSEELVGRQIIAVTNLPTRRVAGWPSEVLVLGAVPRQADVILLRPDEAVPNGTAVA